MGKRRSLLDATRERTCKGRVIFHSKKDADGAAARARKRSGHNNIRRYNCESASHYHIGHSQDSGKRSLADSRATTMLRKVERPDVSAIVAGGKSKLERVGNVTGSLWSTNTGAEEGV